MGAFFRAVLTGTFAGASAPLLITLPLALMSLGDVSLGSSMIIAIVPVLLTLPIVLGCSIVIGLPVTAIFRRLAVKSVAAYVATGCIAGFIVPLLLLRAMGANDGWWTALLGTFSGGVTASRWFQLTAEYEPT